MASLIDFLSGTAVEVIIFGVAGAVLYRLWHRASFLPQRTQLLPFNRGVLLQGEQVIRVLESGKHWIMPKQTLMPVDIRPKPLGIAPHDLLTQDGQPVRIALGGEFRVANPVLYITGNSNSTGAFLVALEQAFPLSVAEYTATDVLHEPALIATRIRERIEPRATQLGIELTSLDVSSLLPLYGNSSPNSL